MPAPEATARESIDAQLEAAGWGVQDLGELNLSASCGVAVRELRSRGGPADEQEDYLEAWQNVDSKEGVPPAVAPKAFGSDPKPIIGEFNEVLVA